MLPINLFCVVWVTARGEQRVQSTLIVGVVTHNLSILISFCVSLITQHLSFRRQHIVTYPSPLFRLDLSCFNALKFVLFPNQELEERERSLVSAQSRNEVALQTLQRESRYQEDRAKELDRKASRLELECHNEEQSKECARKSMNDFVRRLGSTLGTDVPDSSGAETLISRTHELVQVGHLEG